VIIRIFGGSIMSLMDLAAGVSVGTCAKAHVATVAVSNLSFRSAGEGG
jgi:acyl-CoA hydrolase